LPDVWLIKTSNLIRLQNAWAKCVGSPKCFGPLLRQFFRNCQFEYSGRGLSDRRLIYFGWNRHSMEYHGRDEEYTGTQRCTPKLLNIHFYTKFGFLTKIWIFDQNLYFWPKFGFLIKILIFDQNLDFWPKFGFLTKILIFDQNFDF